MISFNPSLLFLEQTLDSLLDPSHWLALCPFLSVTQKRISFNCAQSELELKQLGNELSTHGFFKVPSKILSLPEGLTELLALGIETLIAHGYPSNFILLYDESWFLGNIIGNILIPASGNVLLTL